MATSGFPTRGLLCSSVHAFLVRKKTRTRIAVMPALTPCAAFPYPVPSDPPDVARDLKRLADAIDAYVCTHSGKSVGEVFHFWDMGKGFPDGALLCDGSTFSPTTYPALNTFLGGNQLPDLRGRFLFGANVTFPAWSFGGFFNAIPITHDHAGTPHTHPMPHDHAATVGNDNADHSHGFDVNSSTTGHHGHGFGEGAVFVQFAGGAGGAVLPVGTTWAASAGFAQQGNHYHNIAGGTGGRGGGVHQHSVTLGNPSVATGQATAGRTSLDGAEGTNRNLPPFYAVAILMQAR